jgi:hypothetical protein
MDQRCSLSEGHRLGVDRFRGDFVTLLTSSRV